MAEQRRRSTDAAMVFNGQALSNALLADLWTSGTRSRAHSRERVLKARGLRLKTETVRLRPAWARRHPEATDWVVKVLPERRTLERDLIASVAATEPVYSRVPMGFLDRDRDHAEALEHYLEEWRREYVPFQAFAEKGTEDGEYGVVVLPTDVDMAGCPDFYDRLDEDAVAAMPDDDGRKRAYERDEDDPRRRYVRRTPAGEKAPNPRYDRDASGRPTGESGARRDAEKSKAAHADAVRRYLLGLDQGAASVRVIPALDCVPYLVRGTKRARWKLFALLERTLYYPEELLSAGYGWLGMGDRALIPRGYDATGTTGQGGQVYLYTLYWTWCDPNDARRIERPIIAYSVGGNPTWIADPGEDRQLPESGLAIIDLYETHGLEGPFWSYHGGLHTSDDDPDYYYEPYLWPLAESILGIEGMQTAINAATAVSAFTGYYHRPDPALLALDGEALIDQDGQLRRPRIPEAGEIETSVGEISPATPAQVSPDAWRAVGSEYESLRSNTTLEQAGAGATPSGHAMVVKETIAQTAKRHIREGAADASRFCGERVLRILTAIAREHDVRWPIQTVTERPVGSMGEVRVAGSIVEFDPAWVGEGEYKLGCDYPADYNPVKVETAASMADRGYGSPEDVWAAEGKTDAETEWAKILKWRIRQSPEYVEAMVTRLAKLRGDKVMQRVLALQHAQRMTPSGPPGFEQGIPTAALAGPGEGQGPPGGGGVGGGPTTAQSSLGGMMAAQTGPAMADARAAAMVPGTNGSA